MNSHLIVAYLGWAGLVGAVGAWCAAAYGVVRAGRVSVLSFLWLLFSTGVALWSVGLVAPDAQGAAFLSNVGFGLLLLAGFGLAWLCRSRSSYSEAKKTG